MPRFGRAAQAGSIAGIEIEAVLSLLYAASFGEDKACQRAAERQLAQLVAREAGHAHDV